MSDYPKIKFEKYNPEECKLNGREFKCLILDDPLPMTFSEFKRKWGKDRNIMAIDEPTRVRQKLAASINPARKSLWVKEFEKWLKDNGKE